MKQNNQINTENVQDKAQPQRLQKTASTCFES